MIKVTAEHSSQYIKDPVSGLSHRRQHAVDIDGVGCGLLFDMRDLLQGVAYRLDTGREGYIENHILAVALRSLSETYYPYNDDFATYISEEFQANGETIVVPNVDLPFRLVDTRLLGLEDGYAVLRASFEEQLIGEQARYPTLLTNSMDTLDFAFPERAISTHGIKGLRISKIDFLSWFRDQGVLENAYRPLKEVVEEYNVAFSQRRTAYEQRMTDRYGHHCFGDTVGSRSSQLTASEASSVLEELAGLTT